MQGPGAAAWPAELAAVMDEQLQVLQDLEHVQRRMSEALAGGLMEELDVLLSGTQALMWRLSRIEERRYRLQATLAAGCGLAPADLTFSRLLDLAPAAERATLAAYRERYAAAVRAIADRGQANSQLLVQGLAYLDFVRHLLEPGAHRPPAYAPPADNRVERRSAGPRVLDSRA